MHARTPHSEDRGAGAGAAARPHEDAPAAEVVTCFLRHRGEVLLVRRSAEVGSYRGAWGAISGYAEGDPTEGAWREIREETGLEEAVTLVKRGEPFLVEDADAGRRWLVHPFLFDAEHRRARLDWEAVEGEWVSPGEILRRRTVPRLWTSYRRVAPTQQGLAGDREVGAAALSLRALEVLRDAAAERAQAPAPPGDAARPGAGGPPRRDAWAALRELALDLRRARPAMPVVRTRIDAAVSEALRRGRADGVDPALRLEAAAHGRLRAAFEAEERVVAAGAREAAGARVATVSRSGTVERALLRADPPPALVVVAASRPGGEGVGLARSLRSHGVPVLLVPDAALPWALADERIELLLVGADGIFPEHGLVNKVGTRGAVLAAREAGLRCVALAAGDKVAATDARPTAVLVEEVPEEAADVAWRSPWFEPTPLSWFDALLTEDGASDAAALRAVAQRHARAAAWTRTP